MNEQTPFDQQSESLDTVGRLIARAGRRDEPDAALEAQVHAAVLSEWDRLVRLRRRRNVMVASLAAAIAFATVGTLAFLNLPRAPDAVVVARVVRALGDVSFVAADGNTVAVATLAEPRSLRAGELIVTGPQGGINLATGVNVSLRIGPDSRVRWQSAQQIELLEGALYLDSPVSAEPDPNALAVATRYGKVTHLGTQYLAQIGSSGLTVRVREGIVAIQLNGSRVLAHDAEEVAIGGDGTIRRTPIPISGPTWNWVESLAGDFDIANRSLLEFLQWAARETGRSLQFADPAVREDTRATVLQGSTRGMSIEAALDTVMSTTALTVARDDDSLMVSRR